MYGITELVKSSYQAAMKMDNLNLSFESIYGSSAKAGAQMDFVRKISDELGMSFIDTAEGAKKLFAAARGTEVEKDANQIFKAFSTMGTALKLTGDETNSVFLAVSQMISKGKVSAEELRLQLAERMPGAVTLFAKSIGVTTKELDQMLQNGQVGLDSLRKFALEVQNTYAAGAAGASKGLQAELNRVSNAWFDLKRAFVDAKGSAETLSVISDVLRGIGNSAPAISAVGAALIRLSVSIGAVYAATKAILSLQAAMAAASGGVALLTGGLAKMGLVLRAFIASPLGVAVALGAVVAGVWSFVSTRPNAMKAIEGYTYSFDEMGDAAKKAAGEVQKLNDENKKREIELASKKAEASYGAFKGALKTPDRAMEIQLLEAGVIAEIDYSPFYKSLQELKKGGAAWNATVDAAQKLGADAGVELDKMIAEGSDPKVFKAKLDSYAIQFKSLFYDMKTAGASDEITKQFDAITQSILGAANAADTDKRALKDLQDGTTSATDDLKTFSNAYDAIFKSAKETELGKRLTYQTEAKGAAKQLVDMVPAVEAARAKIEELKGQSAENNAELKAAQEVIQKNNDAFIMLGQAAIKSKMDLSVLQEGIRLAGEAAGLTAEKIKDLQAQAAKGFRIGGIQTMGEIGAELDIEKLMAGATAGQKKTLSVLQGYAKDKQQALEMAKAVRKGSVEGLTIALKDPSVTQEDIATLWKKANEATASVDSASGAKKAQSNWESVNSTIQQATKTLETWRSKVDESKSDQFGATTVSEVEKIDKAIRSSKGNTEQLAQLRNLREEILKTGELRKQQIKEEQEREQSKEMTRYRTRITAGYKKLEGVDNIETYAAAKGQYDDDVKFFQHALDEKRISQEDFNSYMMMLNKTLADAQLRSQTDMFSRLKVAANDYYKKYGDFTRHIGDVVTTAMDSSAKAIAAFARSGASDFSSLASAFARMADQILTTATDLFAQQAVSALWKGLGDWVGSLSSPFGGAYSSGKVQEVPRGATYGPSANGNVFSGGNLSAYSGSIVASPTYFSASSHVPAYATGAGLMGEAGPEGIFPLTRINGKLGVRAEMGQSQPTILNQAVSVNINNASGSQVTTQQTKDNQGNISIDVMIEEAVGKSMRRPGSSPYKSLQSNFGARQQLASV
jgi:lambda family phage tail tape measure protein